MPKSPPIRRLNLTPKREHVLRAALRAYMPHVDGEQQQVAQQMLDTLDRQPQRQHRGIVND